MGNRGKNNSTQAGRVRVETACSPPPMVRNDFTPVLQIDTREPDPHPWEQHFTLEAVRGTLQTGDLSLAGCSELISLERKTLGDLISCLCTGRERFVKELQRAARIPNFSVIVEASYRDILRGDYRSNMTPASAWGSIIALQERYRIPFYFAGDMATAAKLAESILVRWFKEHQKALEAATRGHRLAGQISKGVSL